MRRILAHRGEPERAPALAPSRTPPMGAFAREAGQGEPGGEVDQRPAHDGEPW
ncbi:MAG: hypothetical protein JW819_12215 [Candidatus Krumholzibacteriota bacterium]|nr:hypothetical protein [Candidatus Krumholzibacteriota bacterium]